ncbi:endonuclease V family protein [Populus alba x Populus x berolinensis]|nr:endonuclease V family protein [Populus alba x Populus x berolinensis]
MDDHGLRHGRDRGESSSSIEIQNQWREIQDLLKERLTTQDDFPWKLPIPSSSGNVVVEEEEGTLLKYVGGVDVSYSKELDSAAAASTAACGCGSLVVLDITTPTLQVVYQDFFLLTNFDVPYIPSFLAFREAPILLQLLQKMKNTDNPFYPQVVSVLFNSYCLLMAMVCFILEASFGLACHLGVLANIPTIGIGKNLHHVDGLTQSGVRQLLQAKDSSGEDFITLKGSSGCVWGAVTDFTDHLLLTQHKNFISE